MRTTTTLLVAIVLLASCNQYQKTPSGLSYKITKGGSNQTLKQGQFVKFNIEYKVPPKDSVITSSFGHIPAYLVVDTSRPSKHSFLEIITKCAPGDKIDFVMNVDTLKKLGMLEYNNVFHARDMIKGRVEILKTFSKQEEASADLQKESDIEKQKELKDIQAFATGKGIKTQATPSGVLVEVQNPGEAQKADVGKQVKMMYKGTFNTGFYKYLHKYTHTFFRKEKSKFLFYHLFKKTNFSYTSKHFIKALKYPLYVLADKIGQIQLKKLEV